jgi:hypothetical protein
MPLSLEAALLLLPLPSDAGLLDVLVSVLCGAPKDGVMVQPLPVPLLVHLVGRGALGKSQFMLAVQRMVMLRYAGVEIDGVLRAGVTLVPVGIQPPSVMLNDGERPSTMRRLARRVFGLEPIELVLTFTDKDRVNRVHTMCPPITHRSVCLPETRAVVRTQLRWHKLRGFVTAWSVATFIQKQVAVVGCAEGGLLRAADIESFRKLAAGAA